MAQLRNLDTQTIEQQLETMTQDARTACSEKGMSSSECATAWEAVEEVQAEISHRRFFAKSALQQYCEERPDAAECRIYDV